MHDLAVVGQQPTSKGTPLINISRKAQFRQHPLESLILAGATCFIKRREQEGMSRFFNAATLGPQLIWTVVIGVLFFCGCGQSYPRSKKWIFKAIVLLICGLVFS